jgi:hypothetical protein
MPAAKVLQCGAIKRDGTACTNPGKPEFNWRCGTHKDASAAAPAKTTGQSGKAASSTTRANTHCVHNVVDVNGVVRRCKNPCAEGCGNQCAVHYKGSHGMAQASKPAACCHAVGCKLTSRNGGWFCDAHATLMRAGVAVDYTPW